MFCRSISIKVLCSFFGNFTSCQNRPFFLPATGSNHGAKLPAFFARDLFPAVKLCFFFSAVKPLYLQLTTPPPFLGIKLLDPLSTDPSIILGYLDSNHGPFFRCHFFSEKKTAAYLLVIQFVMFFLYQKSYSSWWFFTNPFET